MLECLRDRIRHFDERPEDYRVRVWFANGQALKYAGREWHRVSGLEEDELVLNEGSTTSTHVQLANVAAVEIWVGDQPPK